MCARCVEQQQQTRMFIRVVSATPPSIVIVALVLGGPECVHALCWKAAAADHSDSGSCAWGSGVCARRVEQQQQC